MSRLRSSVSSSVWVATIILALLLPLDPSSSQVQAWGESGHRIICNIAEHLLNPIALASVEELLPDVVDGNLSDLCSWADEVRREPGYKWSSDLHYILVPDGVCNYLPTRDCHSSAGTPGFCASAGVQNYTDQLRIGTDKYNLTEALLFLAHIVGDIHQPLHVGFEGDKGGNLMEVYWYGTRSSLQHVWDSNMITKDEEVYFDGDISELTKSLYDTIVTGIWSEEAKNWAICDGGQTVCPDVYASESVEAACLWAYNGVSPGATLSDEYFLSRVPVVQRRLAQAGTRLAGILNRLFTDDED